MKALSHGLILKGPSVNLHILNWRPISIWFTLLRPPAPILARSSSVESSTSLESASTLWPGPSDDLHHSLDKEESNHDARPAAAMGDAEKKGCNATRHTKGPNRKRFGTGYGEIELYMDSGTVTKGKLPSRGPRCLEPELSRLLRSSSQER